MTLSPPDDALPGHSPASSPADGPGQWHALPARSRLVFLLASAPWLALPGAAAGATIGQLLGVLWDTPPGPLSGSGLVVASVLCGVTIGAGFGIWLGLKRYRHTFWRLDHDGLAVRRGRMWQRETRVPITRVQHLDLKRGPLQRRRDLATLVVHTAGTRNSSVVVPNLDLADAEHLRDQLGHQIDLDDED